MKSSFPGFSPDALRFLRSLKRNNRREWFKPRKEQFEALIKAPMLDLIGCLNEEFARFSPNHVTPPQKALFRIYRDTRFSHDKKPYKTHVSAIFPYVTAGKKQGACYYFHFNAEELLVFAGVWSPDPDELLAIRGLIAQDHDELRHIVSARKVRSEFGELQGEQLSRMPKGFPADHPAEAWLRQKQWYLEGTVSPRLITSPRLLPELVRYFRLMSPLVEFMDRPFAERKKASRPAFSMF